MQRLPRRGCLRVVRLKHHHQSHKKSSASPPTHAAFSSVPATQAGGGRGAGQCPMLTAKTEQTVRSKHLREASWCRQRQKARHQARRGTNTMPRQGCLHYRFSALTGPLPTRRREGRLCPGERSPEVDHEIMHQALALLCCLPAEAIVELLAAETPLLAAPNRASRRHRRPQLKQTRRSRGSSRGARKRGIGEPSAGKHGNLWLSALTHPCI